MDRETFTLYAARVLCLVAVLAWASALARLAEVLS
jgi:hypothetical protein